MGKAYGTSLVSKFSQLIVLSSEFKIEEQMNIHMTVVNRLGWGKYTFNKMDWSIPEFEIELTGNIFLENCINGNEAICYFIRGVLCGALEEITDNNLNIDLAECYRTGGEACVFSITPEKQQRV
jgi:predicted hydrocarbon binding protein